MTTKGKKKTTSSQSLRARGSPRVMDLLALELGRNELESHRLVSIKDLLSIAEKIQRVPLYLAAVDYTDKNSNMVASRSLATRAFQELTTLLGDSGSLSRWLFEQRAGITLRNQRSKSRE